MGQAGTLPWLRHGTGMTLTLLDIRRGRDIIGSNMVPDGFRT